MAGVRSSNARSRDSKTAALLGQACKVLLVGVEEVRSSAVCSELIETRGLSNPSVLGCLCDLTFAWRLEMRISLTTLEALIASPRHTCYIQKDRSVLILEKRCLVSFDASLL